jgi:hypothetical protein
LEDGNMIFMMTLDFLYDKLKKYNRSLVRLRNVQNKRL